MRPILLFVLAFAGALPVSAQPDMRVAAVQYEGGGDWYQAQTPLPNMIAYLRDHSLIRLADQPEVVDLASDRVFGFPVLVLSGHGNIVLSTDEALRLRRYLQTGGFLFVDDDYGLDPYIRRELKKVFPDQDLVELADDHPIYRSHFEFTDGPPKIHEHDGASPRGYGLFHEGRLVVFYLHESNITDGWESALVHPNSAEIREAALRMGVNVLAFALTQ
jgi:hypothetical protein